jgi:hypothetical protein
MGSPKINLPTVITDRHRGSSNNPKVYNSLKEFMDVNRGSPADQYGAPDGLPSIHRIRKSSRPTADTSGMDTGIDAPTGRKKRGVSNRAIEVMLLNVKKNKL